MEGAHHRDATQSRAPEQAFASSEVVGNVEGENDHPECLGDTIKPSCEKLEVGARDSKG